MARPIVSTLIFAAGALALAGCQDDYNRNGSRHWVAMSSEVVGLMSEKGMSKNDPILIRSFKKEAELEIWKKASNGKYALLKSFPICRWSGQLGPKVREGDRQAPEGFYAITPQQLNPNSSFHLSFDTGFPNAYDRAHSRSGSYLMVHGACSSRGCFSMTDKQIEDIYALVRDAQSGGQRAVQMQSFPFRMTPENLAKHRFDPNIAFWKNLKEGNDFFEVTGDEPRVNVCGGRYSFNTGEQCDPNAIPSDVRTAVARKQSDDNARIAELVKNGTPAVKVLYADGGQHNSFRGTALAYAGGSGSESMVSVASNASAASGYAEMSRPDAIGSERDVPIGADGKPLKQTPKPAPVMVAANQSTPAAAAAKPVAPQTTTIARASAATPPAEAAPKAEQKGVFARMLGAVGLDRVGLGGSTAEATPPAREEPIPLPPRRNQRTSAAPANSAFAQSQ